MPQPHDQHASPHSQLIEERCHANSYSNKHFLIREVSEIHFFTAGGCADPAKDRLNLDSFLGS